MQSFGKHGFVLLCFWRSRYCVVSECKQVVMSDMLSLIILSCHERTGRRAGGNGNADEPKKIVL